MLSISAVYNDNFFNFLPGVTYWDMSKADETGFIVSIGWLAWSLDFDYIGRV